MGGSFGMAIMALTVVVNVILMPFTLKQIRASKAIQDLQPKLAELQKKHAKDRQKLAQEQMRLYKESGMNPAGCLGPMLIQMPIWIALYQSIILSLAVAPEGLLNMARYLYSWPLVYSMLPLSRNFMWLDLATPDTVLAILVGVTMYIQQKMATPTGADTRQQSQAKLMMWMMPLMFTFLALSFPSGLSLFWVASSIVRIGIQYYVTGWGGLNPTPTTGSKPAAADKKYLKLVSTSEEKSVSDVGADISDTDETEKRSSGLSYPFKPSKTRYQPGRDRSRHPKKK
jgi:YidC/Oxa1 family membrane protein insertase